MKTLHAVLFSGGVDSTTLLTELLRNSQKDDHVVAVTIDYGQTHNVETERASEIIWEFTQRGFAGRLEKLHLHFPSTIHSFASTLSLPKENRILEGFRAPITTFPYRNAILALLAAGRLELFLAQGYPHKARDFRKINIYMAIHQTSDPCEPVYPDTTPEFVGALQKLLVVTRSIEIPVSIRAPFAFLCKSDIIEKAWEVGAPLHLTWTCYNPVEERGVRHACGECAACEARAIGFGGKDKDPAFSEDAYQRWFDRFNELFPSVN